MQALPGTLSCGCCDCRYGHDRWALRTRLTCSIRLRISAGTHIRTENVVAFENTVSYEIETVKGLGNIILGGEGLFLTKLVGPGRVIIQSQNFGDFAGRIISMMPKSN